MRRGIMLAVASGVCFGMSGPLGKGLLDAGFSPAAAILLRLWVAAAVTVIPMAVLAPRRLATVLRAPRTVIAYGLLAVVAVNLSFYNAVAHMSVTVALVIEFSAPVLVIGWLWARRGHRPTAFTLLGAAIAMVGLLLVVGLTGSGTLVSPVGIAWSLVAMVGVAGYFLLVEGPSGAEGSRGPAGGPAEVKVDDMALAAGGLFVGAVAISIMAAVGLVDMQFAFGSSVDLGHAGNWPWWVAVLVVGVVCTGAGYATGIAAIGVLGPVLASFLAFAEVIASGVASWLMIGERLSPVQIGGALLIGVGVVAVKLGERTTAPREVARPHDRSQSSLARR